MTGADGGQLTEGFMPKCSSEVDWDPNQAQKVKKVRKRNGKNR